MGARMEDRQLQDGILTLIVAGHETTASSLNWFWYLLGQAPGVASRIHAEVDAGGIALPAGADVLISPYLVHRHPAHWSDPERFDPGRFGGGEEASRNRFVYLPFGLGARACIGEHLALVAMHTHVATLARRFDVELVPGQSVEREPRVNLRTRRPLRMIPRVRPLSLREP
jgi:cytochrome P450